MSNRRKKRRPSRGRFGFVYSLLAVMAFLLVVSVSAGLFFKISSIEVIGAVSVKPEEVRAASGLRLGENLLFVNKFSAGRKIIGDLPTVKEVRIRRKLPSTLVVEITESVPCARFEHEGYFWTMDSDGKLLSFQSLPGEERLPAIQGVELLAPVIGGGIAFPEADREKQGVLLELLKAMTAAGMLADVQSVDLSKGYELHFQYLERFDVALGMPVDMPYKLTFLKAAVDKLGPDSRGSLDLSSAQDKVVRFVPAA